MPNGLLDFIRTPEGQGLLGSIAGYAANAGRGTPVNNLGRGGLAGLLAYGRAQDNEREIAQTAKTNELRDMQIAAYKADVAAKNDALARTRAKQAALPTLFTQPGMAGGEAAPATLGDVPMFSQPMGVTPMRATSGGLDVQRALREGFDVDEITKLAGLQNLNRPKVARTIEVDDGNGGKATVQLDEFGQPVGQKMAGYVAPVQVNQGDRVSFVRPNAGVTMPVGMSPSEQDASRRGWATVGQGERRLALDVAGRAPAGYRYKADGSMEIIPGGPADLKASAAGQQKVSEAKDVLGLLDEVDTLLPNATGSYAGVGLDEAARFFGASTEGAETTAQLKTLQGALISKMPKMTGPQSDKDVQLYREMAGQVADPTLPVSARQKASSTIRRLNEKYAGMPEGSSKPKTAEAKPPAPMKGMVRGGYKFKGGDPANQNNWEKV